MQSQDICTNFSVPLQMFPDGDRLFDQVVQIFGQFRRQSLGLQDSQNLVTSDEPHLGDTMGVTEYHTWNYITQK